MTEDGQYISVWFYAEWYGYDESGSRADLGTQYVYKDFDNYVSTYNAGNGKFTAAYNGPIDLPPGYENYKTLEFYVYMYGYEWTTGIGFDVYEWVTGRTPETTEGPLSINLE